MQNVKKLKIIIKKKYIYIYTKILIAEISRIFNLDEFGCSSCSGNSIIRTAYNNNIAFIRSSCTTSTVHIEDKIQ